MTVVVKINDPEGTLLFEADSSSGDLAEIGWPTRAKAAIENASAAGVAVSSTIGGCARQMLAALDDLTTDRRSGGTLSKAEMEIGIKVTGEGNVLVAKGTAEANLKITLTWDLT